MKNTFTVDRRKGVRQPNGRMAYLIPGREYKIDGRRKGYFDPYAQVLSKDIYDTVVGVEPEAAEVYTEETTKEEE